MDAVSIYSVSGTNKCGGLCWAVLKMLFIEDSKVSKLSKIQRRETLDSVVLAPAAGTGAGTTGTCTGAGTSAATAAAITAGGWFGRGIGHIGDAACEIADVANDFL